MSVNIGEIGAFLQDWCDLHSDIVQTEQQQASTSGRMQKTLRGHELSVPQVAAVCSTNK